MSETIEKAVLLDKIQAGYTQLESILAPLSAAQMTMPTVNGTWSVKDNLAHLTVWQDYLLAQLEGIRTNTQPPAFFVPDLSTDDEINEHVYQENKNRPLEDVLAAFRASYQRVLAAVSAMSAGALNTPAPWGTSGNPIWGLIAGNTYEHCEEHGGNIRRWLEAS